MSQLLIQALLIEDNPGDSRLIREMLIGGDTQFRLTRVETLERGIRLAQSDEFDIALLDLSLPDSSGLETLYTLRDAVPTLPIVVLTGFDDRRVGVQAVQSGAQDYLVKGEVSAGLLQRSIQYAIQRQTMAVQLLQLAALEERQRLARDLHDSVSQTLFTSSVIAESALKKFNRDPERAYQLLGQLHVLTQNALAEMRLLLLELRPRALDQAPLHTLIGHLAQSVRGRDGVEVETHLEPLTDMLAETKLALYRIVQEALNNISKHANASRVSIALEGTAEHGFLRIHDNGRGFDPAQAAEASLGMGIMQERAASISAQLLVESAEGRGTQVSVSWGVLEGIRNE